jgi:hypothetical protein
VDDAAMADMVDETETVDKVSTWGGIPAKNSKGENLLLFIGHFYQFVVSHIWAEDWISCFSINGLFSGSRSGSVRNSRILATYFIKESKKF